MGPTPAEPGPADPGQPALTPHGAALIAEACTKSGVLWVRPGDEPRFHAAWHVWHDDAVHVIFGIGEQMLPLLTGTVEVAVPSKESGQRVVTFAARAELVPARTEEWQRAAAALAAKRLNAGQPMAEQLERWASGAIITRLTPLSVLEAGHGDDSTPSGAAPPPANPASTLTWRPRHLRSRDRARRARRLGHRRGRDDGPQPMSEA